MNAVEIESLIKNSIPFVPPITEGVVIKVYDGDTITIVSKLSYDASPLYSFSVRINNIDCPEIKGKTDEEKQCAQIARNKVSELVLHKKVTLENVSTEKYGRVLADVVIDGVNIAEYLLANRLALSYNGGTKEPPVNWMNYHLYGKMNE